MGADNQRMEECVRVARDGDDLAFVELVRRYQDFAVAYAASLLGDHHLAEDAKGGLQRPGYACGPSPKRQARRP